MQARSQKADEKLSASTALSAANAMSSAEICVFISYYVVVCDSCLGCDCVVVGCACYVDLPPLPPPPLLLPPPPPLPENFTSKVIHQHAGLHGASGERRAVIGESLGVLRGKLWNCRGGRVGPPLISRGKTLRHITENINVFVNKKCR